MGVAASITALPVRAAVVRQQDLAGTAVGVLATPTGIGRLDVLARMAMVAARLPCAWSIVQFLTY
jgi:hypothetical protein